VGGMGSGVRVSVSFQQKYPPGSVPRCPTAAENGVTTKGVVLGGGVDLRLRRFTSSPSQTLRRRLVRTTDDGRRSECSTLAAVCLGFIFTARCICISAVYVSMRCLCVCVCVCVCPSRS